MPRPGWYLTLRYPMGTRTGTSPQADSCAACTDAASLGCDSHPVLGDLDVYDWTVFAGAHAARRAAQIREIGAEA